MQIWSNFERVNNYKSKWLNELIDRINPFRNKLTYREMSEKIDNWVEWFQFKLEGESFSDSEINELVEYVENGLKTEFSDYIFSNN